MARAENETFTESRREEGGLRVRGTTKEGTPAEPLVSVITAVYNGRNLLEKTIKSVIMQTYRNIEYIVIDGGSTDGTIEVIKSYDDFIDYWVTEPDRGVYDAFNKGVGAALGQWLYFLGAGDTFFESEALERIIAYHNNGNLLYGKVLQEADGKLIGGRYSKLRLCIRNIPHQGILYSRDVFDAIGVYDLSYPILSDWAFNIRCFASRRVRPYFVDTTVAIYAKGGLSSQVRDEAFIRDRGKLVRSLGIRYWIMFQLAYPTYKVVKKILNSLR